MDCQRCHELLAAYKHAVSLFTTAERNMRGMVGDDFQVAMNKLRLLHEACLDANAAVTEHWRQDHTNFSQVVAAS
jgi:hypothetical protein